MISDEYNLWYFVDYGVYQGAHVAPCTNFTEKWNSIKYFNSRKLFSASHTQTKFESPWIKLLKKKSIVLKNQTFGKYHHSRIGSNTFENYTFVFSVQFRAIILVWIQEIRFAVIFLCNLNELKRNMNNIPIWMITKNK